MNAYAYPNRKRAGRRLWSLFSIALFVVTQGVRAERIPGRYIVELAGEPVVERASRGVPKGRIRLDTREARAHRDRIRGEQEEMKGRVEARQGAVLGAVDTVANAIFVQMSEEAAAQLAREPGVKRVTPERTFKPLLDRAVQLHRVTDAWQQVGASKAGEGMKIAIIDSGIDAGHAGFTNSGLSAPEGFPRLNYSFDATNTNGKIIVARSYVPLLQYRDPDYSVRDHIGHGTALAMIAAGEKNDAPLAAIQGVAPQAWLGVYKVFGTPGYNDSATDSAILKAIDDAVADGMDVINLSLGDDFAPRLSEDVDVQAVERATQAGVIVVVAAGNNGPGMNTISTPATAPSAIAVGATSNDRTFGTSVQVGGLPAMLGLVGSGPTPATAVQAEVADLAALDGDGLACGSLPGATLSGKVALILRGSCTFETKLINAERAGAVAAIVYATAESPDAIGMSVGAATLPAQMVSHADGLSIRQSIQGGPVTATLRFTLQPVERAGNRITDFSAIGPSVDLGIKPDLAATGGDMYTATQRLNPSGDMFDSSGYTLLDGTSFSAPLVAGAAALLKSARPGLTMEDYRSLLVNTAAAVQNTWKGEGATIQQTGAGSLDMEAALQATVTASPVSLSFGAGETSLDAVRTLKLKNTGSETESFEIAVVPKRGDSAPGVETAVLELAAGATAEVPVRWASAGMTGGNQEGVLEVRGLTSGKSIRVPYWYSAATREPAAITLMSAIASAWRGSVQQNAIFVRITDASGVVLTDQLPEVQAVSGGGALWRVTNYDSDIPGVFGISVQLGINAGMNVFRIQAGKAALDLSISGL